MLCFLCHLVLGAVHGGLLFVVCGFWGLFCFGLPGFWLLWLGVGLSLGLVFWAVCTDFGFWLAVCGWLGLVLLVLFGEFDPGSGRTLAACLTHASRTVKGPAFVGPG